MPPAPPFLMTTGTAPLVLVAPHGGRRDAARRPWGSAPLKVNDLHTAALTAELAARTGAAALINEAQDRNDVDLNRVSDANQHAPGFLERLAELVDGAVRRHGHATLLALHGWNVVQPVVDLGLGCLPGGSQRSAAVSPAFAARALPCLLEQYAARGIAATVGARYPARHRENLLQLFTPRYAEDSRPLVRALAARAALVDAVQLELGIALRWPGAWRSRFLDACAAALPALAAAPEPASAPPERTPAAEPPPPVPRRLEFAGAELSGLLGLDAGRTGRLLLFPNDGGLVLFTGERLGLEPPGASGRLSLEPSAGGDLAVRYEGPLLRFPDTTPFLDLETGLARAHLVEGEVDLRFTAAHAQQGGGEFGAVTGSVALDGVRQSVVAHAFAEEGAPAGPWPRLRAALDLGDGGSLALTLGLPGGQASGFVCRDGRHVAVAAARATFGPADAPLAHVTLDVDLADAGRLRVVARALHSLPVIRAGGRAPVRIEFAVCPAGWLEVGGL